MISIAKQEAALAQGCPMVAFVNLIAGKWAIPLLYRLIVEDRSVRFGVLQKAASPWTSIRLSATTRAEPII